MFHTSLLDLLLYVQILCKIYITALGASHRLQILFKCFIQSRILRNITICFLRYMYYCHLLSYRFTFKIPDIHHETFICILIIHSKVTILSELLYCIFINQYMCSRAYELNVARKYEPVLRRVYVLLEHVSTYIHRL